MLGESMNEKDAHANILWDNLETLLIRLRIQRLLDKLDIKQGVNHVLQ